MSDLNNEFSNITVVKRDGKKVGFDESKIVVAIKKGFDSIKGENLEEHKYTEKDIFKIYHIVLEKIKTAGKDKIKIEEIQDFIEEIKQKNYSLKKRNNMLF